MNNLDKYRQALSQYKDPYLGGDLFSFDIVDSLEENSSGVSLSLIFPYANQGDTGRLQNQLKALLMDAGASSVSIDIDFVVQPALQKSHVESLSKVKNILGIASGKGGVGKSTTAVNLALALVAEGAKVGILDADIYGPSQGMMLGVKPGTQPEPAGKNMMLPLQAQGVVSMSIAYMVDETTPMVWRGPMASGAINQMVNQTQWGELDYLLIDMPPGTGDIHLTLSQKVPMSAAIIITTPQDIALLDAKRGVEMFAKVDIPVLGVIENMSVHICSNCGHKEHIFGEGGALQLASQYSCEMLGALPLDINIRTDVDSGKPSVVADKSGEIALCYRDIARRVGAKLHLLNQRGSMGPSLSIVDD
ncbi:MAG: iron-sulfur cluster carrier protein ApbC [Oceanospirillaceae bacterium]|nr:iron-sulfur cluster carrier protein ApbC [Oceanospirillaceae bacterium]